jgi:hypothetical protein
LAWWTSQCLVKPNVRRSYKDEKRQNRQGPSDFQHLARTVGDCDNVKESILVIRETAILLVNDPQIGINRLVVCKR